MEFQITQEVFYNAYGIISHYGQISINNGYSDGAMKISVTPFTKDAENFVTEMSQVICKIYTPSNVVLKYQPSELLIVFHFFKQQDVVLCN